MYGLHKIIVLKMCCTYCCEEKSVAQSMSVTIALWEDI